MAFSKEDLDDFKTEALEILDTAETTFFSIEAGGEFRPLFDTIFRSLHNLKGASGMMELHILQNHIHELETVFMGFKESSIIPKNYITWFLKGIDGARSILDGTEIQFNYQVEQVEASGVVPTQEVIPLAPVEVKTEFQHSPSALDEFISEGAEIIERISAQLRIVESKQFTSDTINNLYRDIHSLKGAAHLFGYTQLGDIAHIMESKMEPVRDGLENPTKELIDSLYVSIRKIESVMEGISNNTSVAPKQIEESKIEVKMEVKMEEKVEIAPVAIVQAVPTVQLTPIAHAAESGEKEKESESGGSIRVPVALLDNLMTLMGEMVLVRNQVIQYSNDSEDLDFLNLSKRLNLVTSEIQGEMMKTRMQPIGNVLSKYHRVVRDLSQELKKSINLNLHGSETELDKSLLESIKDPLTHIVRNSCDHGIETPDVRRASGKTDQGNINIRSYHEGGQVVIEVADDGKGLHKEALIKKALEKGLVTQAQVPNLSEKEIFNLIFAPGFSTAAVITNVSGRGVGMDVVRTNIEKIGGTVELLSVAGKGTTTKIKIPLTLAIIPALIVKSGHETFAIPQVKLEELVRVDQSASENKIEYLHGAPFYRLRGNVLPLVDLNKILGVETKKTDINTVSNIAVLSGDQCSFGLMVDEIQDTADIVVKPLNRLLRSLQVYSGATILGDGSISLILDIHGISKVAHIETGRENNKSQAALQKSTSDFQDYLLVRLNSPTKHAIVLGYVHRLEEFKRTDLEISADSRVIRYGKTILPIISVSERLGYPPKKDAPLNDMISVVVIQKAGVMYGLEVEEIVDTLSTDADVDSALVNRPGFFGNLNTTEGLIVAIDPFELISIAYPEKVTQIYSGESSGGIARSRSLKKELKILL